jgi:hypothetical protein
MTRHVPNASRKTAMRQRNACRCSAALGSRNTGHYLVCDTRSIKFGSLLGSAPENERITALESDDAMAGAPKTHQHLVDLRLRYRMSSRLLAYIDTLGALWDQAKDLIRDKAIEDYNVGCCDRPGTF